MSGFTPYDANEQRKRRNARAAASLPTSKKEQGNKSPSVDGTANEAKPVVPDDEKNDAESRLDAQPLAEARKGAVIRRD